MNDDTPAVRVTNAACMQQKPTVTILNKLQRRFGDALIQLVQELFGQEIMAYISAGHRCSCR